MNYFELFNIPVSFIIDDSVLKRAYLLKSRAHHPDFYTLHDDQVQEDMLYQSSRINEAYNILKDPVKRMKYILELHGVIASENEQPLSPDFLMQMMEINEEVMELSLDFDPNKDLEIRTRLENIENELYQEVLPLMEAYNHSRPDMGDLKEIKEFYYKSRYLWRLKENLDKFASP